MGEIDKLFEAGFQLHEQLWKLNDLAFMSLKIALKAYFSTYQTMNNSLHIFDDEHGNKSIDINHWPEYSIACSETIVHFQHFTELIVSVTKNIIDPNASSVKIIAPLSICAVK